MLVHACPWKPFDLNHRLLQRVGLQKKKLMRLKAGALCSKPMPDRQWTVQSKQWGVHKFNTCSKLNNTKNGSIKSKGSINGLGSGQGPRTEGGGKFALQGNLEALNRQGYGIMARSLVSSWLIPVAGGFDRSETSLFLAYSKGNDMLCIYRSICNMCTNRLIRLTDGIS